MATLICVFSILLWFYWISAHKNDKTVKIIYSIRFETLQNPNLSIGNNLKIIALLVISYRYAAAILDFKETSGEIL